MTPDIFSIREANENDWDRISHLSSISGYEDYINEMGIRFLKEGTTLMAGSPDPVGFMKITLLPDNLAWFSAIRVHPDFRRLGVGNALMREALVRSKQLHVKGCRLMIEDTNYRSKGLAEKNGFVEVLDLLLFEGGMDVSDLRCEEPDQGEFISLGWEFCLYVPALKKDLCKYTEAGSSIYHYKTPNGNYQMISKPITRKIDHTVLYTSMPFQNLPETFPLKPVEDFKRAQVYEIRF